MLGGKKDVAECSKVETDGMRQARKITVEDVRRRYWKSKDKNEMKQYEMIKEEKDGGRSRLGSKEVDKL